MIIQISNDIYIYFLGRSWLKILTNFYWLDCDIYCHPICSSQLLNNCTATKRPKKMKSVPTIPRSTSVSQNSPPSIGVVGSAPNAGYLSRATSVTVTPPRVPPPVPARSAFVDDEEGRPRSKSFATNPAVVDSLISPRQNGNVQPSFIRSLQNSSAAVSTNTNYNSESTYIQFYFKNSVNLLRLFIRRAKDYSFKLSDESKLKQVFFMEISLENWWTFKTASNFFDLRNSVLI